MGLFISLSHPSSLFLTLCQISGEDALDPLMQLQQNLAALNQVNQAIEANIVRPELPEEADRVEQLLVEFRAVQQRIHDLNQEMEARISVAIEAVAADLRHIYVLTNTGDIMTFDFGIVGEPRKNLTIKTFN